MSSEQRHGNCIVIQRDQLLKILEESGYLPDRFCKPGGKVIGNDVEGDLVELYVEHPDGSAWRSNDAGWHAFSDMAVTGLSTEESALYARRSRDTKRTAQLQELSKDNADLQRWKDHWEKEYQTAMKDVGRLQIALDEMNRGRREDKHEVEVAEAKAAKLEKDLERAQSVNARLEASLDKAVRRGNDLAEDLKGANAEWDKCEKAYEDMERSHKANLTKLATLETAYSRAKLWEFSKETRARLIALSGAPDGASLHDHLTTIEKNLAYARTWEASRELRDKIVQMSGDPLCGNLVEHLKTIEKKLTNPPENLNMTTLQVGTLISIARKLGLNINGSPDDVLKTLNDYADKAHSSVSVSLATEKIVVEENKALTQANNKLLNASIANEAEVKRLRADAEDQQVILTDVKKRLDDMTAARDYVKNLSDSRAGTVNELTASLNRVSTERQALSQANEQQATTIRSLTDQVSKLKANDSLRVEYIQQVELDLASLQGTKKNLQMERNTCYEELTKARQALKDVSARHADALQTIEALRSGGQANQLKYEQDLREHTNALADQHEKYLAAKSTLEAVSFKHAQELSDYAKALADLQQKLETALAALKVKERDNDRVREAEARLHKYAVSLEEDIATLKRAQARDTDALIALNGKCNDLQQQLQDAHDQYESLHNALTQAAERQVDDFEELEEQDATIRSLRADLHGLHNHLKKEKSRMDDYKKAYEQCRAANERLVALKTQAEKKLEQTRLELTALHSAAQVDCERLSSANLALRREVSDLQQRFDTVWRDANEKIDIVQKDRMQVRNSLNAAELSLNQSRAEVTRLQAELRQADQNLKAEADNAEKLKRNVSDLVALRKIDQDVIEHQNAAVENFRKAVDELKESLAEADMLAANNAERVAYLEAELAMVNGLNENNHEASEQRAQRVVELQREVAKLQADLKFVDSESKIWNARARAVFRELEKLDPHFCIASNGPTEYIVHYSDLSKSPDSMLTKLKATTQKVDLLSQIVKHDIGNFEIVRDESTDMLVFKLQPNEPYNPNVGVLTAERDMMRDALSEELGEVRLAVENGVLTLLYKSFENRFEKETGVSLDMFKYGRDAVAAMYEGHPTGTPSAEQPALQSVDAKQPEDVPVYQLTDVDIVTEPVAEVPVAEAVEEAERAAMSSVAQIVNSWGFDAGVSEKKWPAQTRAERWKQLVDDGRDWRYQREVVALVKEDFPNIMLASEVIDDATRRAGGDVNLAYEWVSNLHEYTATPRDEQAQLRHRLVGKLEEANMRGTLEKTDVIDLALGYSRGNVNKAFEMLNNREII